MLPQVNAAGRVFVNHNDFSGPPKFWNRGVGYDNEGRMMTTSTLTASDVYLGGLRLDVQGRLVVTGVTGQPQVSVRGCPVNNGVANAGALTISTAATPVATDPYVSGVRVKNAAPGSELVYFIQSVPTGFLAEMSVGHMLTVGINPQGNRVGYRRNEWGSFLPDDVPSLERLFTNLNNNRLVVQANGDLSSLVLSDIHIERISPPQVWDFGPPNSVVYDGVHTDFTWIVPGFDFVLGENYEVSLS